MLINIKNNQLSLTNTYLLPSLSKKQLPTYNKQWLGNNNEIFPNSTFFPLNKKKETFPLQVIFTHMNKNNLARTFTPPYTITEAHL